MPYITKKQLLPYQNPEHEEYPHIVRFSGGRSSAMMTLLLCEKNLLKRERGDAVVFSNTSAEHPKTYKFAAECKKRIERDYGIPCFWVEYATYEDASRGKWRRFEGYRLVNSKPIEKNQTGYKWRGEIFEEMVSHAGVLPNANQRLCTSRLKIYPTHAFLEDWFEDKIENGRQGHYEEKPFLTLAGMFKEHQINRGTKSEKKYKDSKRFVAQECSTFRESQKWQDYTEAPIDYLEREKDITYWKKADIFGENGVKYVSLLGLRGDEQKRVNNVLSRTIFAAGATTGQCQVKTQPPFETPYFPLHSLGTTKEDVLKYWDKQDFDLKMDDRLGNCCFCFMKGDKALTRMANIKGNGVVPGTPSDFNWWIDLEKKYKRRVPARDGNGTSTFGFFGRREISYASIKEVSVGVGKKEVKSNQIACDCTD